jgi:hypothetical protein
MKRIPGFLAIAILFTLSSAVLAQQPAPAPEGDIMLRQRVFQGPEGAPPPPDANFVFVASESFSGKIVKGAPYSAEAITETIQTLGDGNRIVNRLTTMIYRDSEGRSRREQQLKGLGPFGASEEPLQMIFIADPVTGVSYALDSRTHTALKSKPFALELNAPGVEGQKVEFRVGPGGPASTGVVVAPPLGPPAEGARIAHEGVQGVVGSTTYIFRTKTGPNPNQKTEDLGKQNIEGVEAEGTRTTTTIPAGEIGNDRAIEIVSERWYSPELQVVVMTRHSDPRMGDTTYKLTNISRTEPAKSLFEVPADYTIKEGPQFGPRVAPARMKKPGNPE